jgi:hypothetical protein
LRPGEIAVFGEQVRTDGGSEALELGNRIDRKTAEQDGAVRQQLRSRSIADSLSPSREVNRAGARLDHER